LPKVYLTKKKVRGKWNWLGLILRQKSDNALQAILVDPLDMGSREFDPIYQELLRITKDQVPRCQLEYVVIVSHITPGDKASGDSQSQARDKNREVSGPLLVDFLQRLMLSEVKLLDNLAVSSMQVFGQDHAKIVLPTSLGMVSQLRQLHCSILDPTVPSEQSIGMLEKRLQEGSANSASVGEVASPQTRLRSSTSRLSLKIIQGRAP
jgi:hypothetical protein